MSDESAREWGDLPATDSEVLRERLEAAQAELAAARAELSAVTNSRAWRAWTRFRHGALGRAGAALYRALARGRALQPPAVTETLAAALSPTQLKDTITNRLRALGSLPPDAALALYHPQWPGVGHAAVHLFDYPFPLGEDIRGQERLVAECLLQSGARTFVLNGKPAGWDALAAAIKERAPGVRVLLLWQGTAVQLTPGPAAEEFIRVLELCRQGVFDRLGFGKEGMAEVFARAGIDTRYVVNYVRRPPQVQHTPMGDGCIHIGIFFADLEWRKNVYSQLLAAALVPNSVAHLAPATASLERIAHLIRLPYQVAARQRMPEPPWEQMARMDCNLNLGLSECGPLMPLESLAMGVPCLIGSGSHLFRDHEYLHRRLCVDYHDNPRAIADAITRALAERDEIIRAYNAYIPTYNARAQESVRRFLEPA